MLGYAKSSNLAAYQSAAAHGGVAASDPHRLIVMLLDGAIGAHRHRAWLHAAERDVREGSPDQSRACPSSVSCVTVSILRNGGHDRRQPRRAVRLPCRRLLLATTENKVEMLDEVSALLHEIRGAWLAIAPEGRSQMSSIIADGATLQDGMVARHSQARSPGR